MKSLGERARAAGLEADGDFDTGTAWIWVGPKRWDFSTLEAAFAFMDGYEFAKETR